MLQKRLALLLSAMLGMVSAAPFALADTSPTTGLPYPPGRANDYRPVLVSIDHSEHLPTGISMADVVYEYIHLAGHSTRYLAVYNDNHPTTVGPFSSTRYLGADIRQEWDAPFVYYGGIVTGEGEAIIDVPAYMAELNVPESLLFDGTRGDHGVFRRDTGMNPPRNAVVDLHALVHDHWPMHTETGAPHAPSPPVWRFDLHSAASKDAPIAPISIDYGIAGYAPGFHYSASSRLYERQQNGHPLVDPLTRQTVAVKNVIVQYMQTTYQNDRLSDPRITSTGTGSMDAFINGSHIPGRWVREGLDARTRYYDAQGNELRLAPGQTFIQIVPEGAKVSYQ